MCGKEKKDSAIKISVLAVVSFFIALLSIFTACITSVIALVVGVVSVLRIENSKGKLGGSIFAVTAIILGTAGTIWFAFVGLPRLRCVSTRMVSGTNMSQLGYAILVYSSDYEGKYPTPDKWCDLLIEHGQVTEKQFKCPEVIKDKRGRCIYAINPNCDANSPPDTVLLFETDGGWNRFGGVESMSFSNHGGDGFNVLYNDFSVTFEKVQSILNLNWADKQKQ
jgi:hypothetical protein